MAKKTTAKTKSPRPQPKPAAAPSRPTAASRPDPDLVVAMAPAMAVANTEQCLGQAACNAMHNAVTAFNNWNTANLAALTLSVRNLLEQGQTPQGDSPQALAKNLEAISSDLASAAPQVATVDDLLKDIERVDKLVLGTAPEVAADVLLLVDSLAEGLVSLELAVNLQNQITLSTAAVSAAYGLMLKSPDRAAEALQLIAAAQEAVATALKLFLAAQIQDESEPEADVPSAKAAKK